MARQTIGRLRCEKCGYNSRNGTKVSKIWPFCSKMEVRYHVSSNSDIYDTVVWFLTICYLIIIVVTPDTQLTRTASWLKATTSPPLPLYRKRSWKLWNRTRVMRPLVFSMMVCFCIFWYFPLLNSRFLFSQLLGMLNYAGVGSGMTEWDWYWA